MPPCGGAGAAVGGASVAASDAVRGGLVISFRDPGQITVELFLRATALLGKPPDGCRGASPACVAYALRHVRAPGDALRAQRRGPRGGSGHGVGADRSDPDAWVHVPSGPAVGVGGLPAFRAPAGRVRAGDSL